MATKLQSYKASYLDIQQSIRLAVQLSRCLDIQLPSNCLGHKTARYLSSQAWLDSKMSKLQTNSRCVFIIYKSYLYTYLSVIFGFHVVLVFKKKLFCCNKYIHIKSIFLRAFQKLSFLPCPLECVFIFSSSVFA